MSRQSLSFFPNICPSSRLKNRSFPVRQVTFFQRHLSVTLVQQHGRGLEGRDEVGRPQQRPPQATQLATEGQLR